MTTEFVLICTGPKINPKFREIIYRFVTYREACAQVERCRELGINAAVKIITHW